MIPSKLPQPKATKIQSRSLASTTAALTDQEIEDTRKSIHQVIDTEFEKAVERYMQKYEDIHVPDTMPLSPAEEYEFSQRIKSNLINDENQMLDKMKPPYGDRICL